MGLIGSVVTAKHVMRFQLFIKILFEIIAWNQSEAKPWIGISHELLDKTQSQRAAKTKKIIIQICTHPINFNVLHQTTVKLSENLKKRKMCI